MLDKCLLIVGNKILFCLFFFVTCFFLLSFQLRLMYHKQLIGTALTLLMYHLECALEPDL